MYEEQAKDCNMISRNEIPPDIIILEGGGNMYKNIPISSLLYNELLKNGINCKIIGGINVLDITSHANTFHISGVLLEFNEKLKNDINKIYIICNVIIYSLLNI